MPTEISISQTRLNTSCGWFYPTANSSSDGWIQVEAVSSSSCWIQVTADSILRLTRVPAAGYELRLTPPTADLSSSGWIRVRADSILLLTWVPVAGCDLRLISYCGWLEYLGLILQNTSFLWFIFYRLISVTTNSGSGCCFKNLEEAWRSLGKLEEASRL